LIENNTNMQARAAVRRLKRVCILLIEKRYRSRPPAKKAFVLLLILQGGLDLNKISGVGTIFGLLLHVLPGPNKRRVCKTSLILSCMRGLNK
jgi:hypothetical protein